MSWTLSDTASGNVDKRTELKLSMHTGRDRLLYCAVGDTGATAEYSYPAEFKAVTGISTTTIGGVDPPTAESQFADFTLPGVDLVSPPPPYLNPKGIGRVHGSSAATALAAGLASFLLTCVRFAYFKEDSSDSSRAT